MNLRRLWTRDELLIAMNLYCKLPFGQISFKKPIIVQVAQKLDRTPSSLAMKLVNLASLDPIHQARGVRGLSGASKADRKIWEEFSLNWETLGVESEECFQELIGDELFPSSISSSNNIKSQPYTQAILNETIEITEGYSTTKNRIGQNFFRQMILSAYENRCCITGNPIPELLVASHIIPWHQQSEHRLNPKNGLCLSRTHDVAFDRGLITFDENYKLVLSRYLENFLPESTLEYNFVAYSGKQLHFPNKFHPESSFLQFHREKIFLEL